MSIPNSQIGWSQEDYLLNQISKQLDRLIGVVANSGGGGGGSVSSFSFSNGGGFTGSVTNPTSTPSLSLVLQNANGSQSGKLTSTDWNTFNSKLSETLTNGHIFVGNVTNDATDVALSGDVSLVNSGVLTVIGVKGVVLPSLSTGFLTYDGINWVFDNTTYGIVNSVSGTTNRITSSGGVNPSIDISAAYIGQSSITTLGTITSGIWNSSTIGALYGGTGINSSASTGVAQLNAGTWSISTALANGTTATTQSASDNSTKIATTAYVDTGGLAYWKLASGGTLTASNTITSNTNGFLNFNGTWSATANNQFHANFTGTFTTENVNNDIIYGYKFTPTLVKNASNPTGQKGYGVFISQPTNPASFDGVSLLVQGGATYVSSGLQLGNSSFSGPLGIYQTANNNVTLETGSSGSVKISNIVTLTNQTTISGTGQLIYAQWLANNTGSATGTSNIVTVSGSQSATAGNTSTLLGIQGTLGIQTTGSGVFFQAGGVINLNANATNVTITGLSYAPTLTNVVGLGTHYGLLIQPTAAISGFGLSTPANALVVIGAGTTTLAPLKLTSGTSLTSAIAGTIEFTTDDLFFTISTGAARKNITLWNTLGTSGRVPFATTNGRLTDSSVFTFDGTRLSPQYVTLAAGTAAAGTSPLKFTSGTNLTTAEVGAMEFDGVDLFFTRTGTTRENVLVAVDNVAAPTTTATPTFTSYYGGNTNALGDPNRWISVNILGSVYKIPLYS